MPKVSFVITTYNQSKYICDAVDSALNQTYRDFEIIVVDDGSCDDTGITLKKYGGNIKYIYQENRGTAGARNRGIDESSGEFIALLDGDDIWFPKKIEKQIMKMQGDKELGLVGSYMLTIDSSGRSLNKRKPYIAPGKSVTTSFENGSPLPSTYLIRRSCLKEIGYFCEDVKIFDDLDLYIRMAQKYKVDFLDDQLAGYREHQSNTYKNYSLVYKYQIRFAKKWLSSVIDKKSRYILFKKMSKYSGLLIVDQVKKMNILLILSYLCDYLYSIYMICVDKLKSVPIRG